MWRVLFACVEGSAEAWVPDGMWEGEVAQASWESLPGGEERPAGRWTEVDSSFDGAHAALSEERFGPYAPAVYDTCDPEEAQCSWERDGVSVDWYAAAAPDEHGYGDVRFVPVVGRGEGMLGVPGLWMREIVRTGLVRRYEGVPHAGCVTLRGNGSTGGAHCCELNLLVTTCPEGQTVTMVDTQDGDGNFGAKVVDVDHDGIYEFAATDWSLVLLHVAVWRVLAWSPEGWTEAPPERFRGFYEERERDTMREFEARLAGADERFGQRWLVMRSAAEAASYAAMGGAPERAVQDVVDEVLSHYDTSEDPIGSFLEWVSADEAGSSVQTIHAARAAAPWN